MPVLNRAAIKEEAKYNINLYKDYGNWIMVLLPIIVFPFLFSLSYRFFGFNFEISLDTVQDFERLAEALRDPYVTAPMSIVQSLQSVVEILLIPVQFAVTIYFLKCLRNNVSYPYSAAYTDLKNSFGRYLGIGFVTGLIEALFCFLLIVPGIIKYYQYYMVTYIVGDNRYITGDQARKLSKLITDGHKSELFMLDLSFIGWDILCSMTAGILNIYVLPYKLTARAMYYENLKRYAIEKGLADASAFGETQIDNEGGVQ